ncbi:HlyD family secretion protein [Mycoplana dimorpha]|uniref:HlyD family secretion protein n=2 Tax=Mycoplana dimorpha TaxID=28320 RepID=A0A2T5B958_MYCDI|nr:HlyD family efflux transporter periplasmic adaptor subunit [Mycoplana dimorpha]PTM95453.1 HlyD family secretion protein [Mycoplana dimorpha]
MDAGSRRRLLIALAVAAVTGLLATRGAPAQDAERSFPGMVRRTEIRIAPEISGRLGSIAVSPGEKVRKGDLLAVIDNPDLVALVGEAKAAAASARADRDRVLSGVRSEEVAIADESVHTAEANLVLAQQQYTRTSALLTRNVASRQAADEAAASLAKAEADLDLKRARAAAARAGPTVEERALAEARVALADATVAQLGARLDKTKLIAPCDGTVRIRVAEPGEIMGPGKPVMTLETDERQWFAFTLREDQLQNIALGAAVTLVAQDGRRIAARVTELRPLGEFATWRAARAVGDHDVNSFRVRFDADEAVNNLEPGMTVWLARP